MKTYYSKSQKSFYHSVIHGTNIPDDAVVITSKQRRDLLVSESEGKILHQAFDAHGVTVPVNKPLNIDSEKLLACEKIDVTAGAARTRFATNSAFIETEYQRAYDTAVAWINSGYQGDAPAPVKSDAEAFGRTEQEAAQFIKATGDGWFTVLDQIRDSRLKGKQAVEQSPDDADFMAVALPFIEQLEALKPEGQPE